MKTHYTALKNRVLNNVLNAFWNPITGGPPIEINFFQTGKFQVCIVQAPLFSILTVWQFLGLIQLSAIVDYTHLRHILEVL